MEEEIPFSLGIWHVKDGKEQEFADLWEEFADWTRDNVKGSGFGYLLQDSEDDHLFISFGDWESAEDIKNWRETKEFKEFTEKTKSFVDRFEPHTFHLAATSEVEEEL